MKNKIKLLGTLIMIVGIVALFAGCFSMPMISSAEMRNANWGIFGNAATIPVKDFEARGLVFTEVAFQVTDKGKITGEVFTYQNLLKEAQKLGADAIINVTIDRRVENITTGLATNKQETWYGSALAIKYTNALTQGQNLTVNTPHTFSTSSSASVSSEQ